ncbi:hypothetical protein, conserved [Eimeria maxima]|uniref:Uncharacterized protein n=1 Tax=Eimeria maxima TaxID=5804 RepID=U6M9U1_EIMMA|nr:hypothetical protein, conserved [Eimeria maxima]CDJ58425.1 hypothetical protein, conserved [Eimeria maxima]
MSYPSLEERQLPEDTRAPSLSPGETPTPAAQPAANPAADESARTATSSASACTATIHAADAAECTAAIHAADAVERKATIPATDTAACKATSCSAPCAVAGTSSGGAPHAETNAAAGGTAFTSAGVSAVAAASSAGVAASDSPPMVMPIASPNAAADSAISAAAPAGVDDERASLGPCSFYPPGALNNPLLLAPGTPDEAAEQLHMQQQGQLQHQQVACLRDATLDGMASCASVSCPSFSTSEVARSVELAASQDKSAAAGDGICMSNDCPGDLSELDLCSAATEGTVDTGQLSPAQNKALEASPTVSAVAAGALPAGCAAAASAGGAAAAAELRALRDLVESLQAENRRLKEALSRRRRSSAPTQQNEGEAAAAGAAAAAAEKCNCVPPQLQEPQGEEKQKQQVSSPNAEEARATAFRKGRAPGAPPRSRGPPGRPPGAEVNRTGCLHPGGASNNGSSSSSAANGGERSRTEDNALSLWGWSPPNEPLSSLRSCCADRLLLGSCYCTESRSQYNSDADGEASSQCVVTAVTAGPLEASWLLQLEEAVHSTLAEQQQQQQTRTTLSTLRTEPARAVLKTAVEEIGFSVLDMDQQQHGAAEVAVATDPRLLEWFVAPTSPSSSHPSLSLSSHSRGVHIAGHSASQGTASSKHSKNALLSRAEERRQTSTLPATLRKSISISLSALRRGCADRLNFCRRLQSDLLQCSLSPSALELLLELVPDLSKATERRQLWLDARDALSKHSACARRPLDDEESFAAFVFKFEALHQRLELLSFLNSKTMEAHLSSLLVQIQVKLDCLAMLRRKSPRIGQCVRAAARAASVVSSLAGRKGLNAFVAEAVYDGTAKENVEPSAANSGKAQTRAEAPEAAHAAIKIKEETAQEAPKQEGNRFPMFRWPIKTQYGFGADGSIDKSRSLLKVIATHTGRPLDTTELALLKRASQKPLVAVLEQEVSLVHMLLLLHRAAMWAATSGSSGMQTVEQQQEAVQDPTKALAARLLQCCYTSGSSNRSSRGGSDTAEGETATAADEPSSPKGQHEAETCDLLLSVIPKLVMNHHGRLKALTRLSAQLLREYAAFVCWLGDRSSFLPLQLNLHAASSKQETPWVPQGPSLPSVLAATLPSTVAKGGKSHAKPDAFERLYSFLEELEKHADSNVAPRPTRKHLLERRCCSGSSRSNSPSSSSSSSSLPVLSPGSSPERRKQQKTQHASNASSYIPREQQPTATAPAAAAGRCFPLPGMLNGGGPLATPAALRSLLSRGTSFQLKRTKNTGAAAPPAESGQPAPPQPSRHWRGSSSSRSSSSEGSNHQQQGDAPSVYLTPHAPFRLSSFSPSGAAAAAPPAPAIQPCPTGTPRTPFGMSTVFDHRLTSPVNSGEESRSPGAASGQRYESWRAGVRTSHLKDDEIDAAPKSEQNQTMLKSAKNPETEAETAGVRISLNKAPTQPKQQQPQQQQGGEHE